MTDTRDHDADDGGIRMEASEDVTLDTRDAGMSADEMRALAARFPSVVDFGADPTGVDDATAAFNAALAMTPYAATIRRALRLLAAATAPSKDVRDSVKGALIANCTSAWGNGRIDGVNVDDAADAAIAAMLAAVEAEKENHDT